MEFLISRDFLSIAFIRCAALVPKTNKYAEGTGFSIHTALEKCRSELIERSLYLEKRNSTGGQFTCLGMAAHPELDKAEAHAYLETLEYLAVDVLNESLELHGLPLWHGNNFKFWVSRAWGAYLAVIVFRYRGQIFAVQSIGSSRIKAVFKAWNEYRKVHIYSPSVKSLERATVLNEKLGSLKLEKLKFKVSLLGGFDSALPRLSSTAERRGEHFVVYVTQTEEGEEK